LVGSYEVYEDEEIAADTSVLLRGTIREVHPTLLGSSTIIPRNPTQPKLELFAEVNDAVKCCEFIPESIEPMTLAETSPSEEPSQLPEPVADTSSINKIFLVVSVVLAGALGIGGFVSGCYMRYMRLMGGRERGANSCRVTRGSRCSGPFPAHCRRSAHLIRELGNQMLKPVHSISDVGLL
jgi:hypothetical protein